MAKQKSRWIFIDQIFLTSAFCIFITGLFWCFFSANQNAKDIFGISGGFVTIVGFYLTLLQLAKLRDERDIVNDTRILEKLDDTKEYLFWVINRLSLDINRDVVLNCIENLNRVQSKVMEISAQKCRYFDCIGFREHINDIIEDLRNSLNKEGGNKLFDSPIFIERLYALIETVVEAKALLTENID